MAINLRNNVTGTGLNLVTNPILKSSAINPVNIGVKTPVNQYKTEDPRYANKTQVNTQVKTPVQTTKPMTPVNQTQVQTQVQTPVNNNQSRFIGFQNNNTLQNSLNILQQRQQTSKKKENLTIPTLQNTNTKNANTYIQQMKVVQDFEADVYKNQGKMTKEQIAKLYPEFSNKLDKAMDFQKNLRPIVKNGEYVDETQIRKYFPEFLGNPNLQPKKELEKQAKSIDDENKKIFNKAKNVNQDLLSYNGKVFANFMSELSNLPNQVRKQYNINSDATDSDIITYLYNNDKNFKQEFDRIQNLELTDQDKARLGVGGMWLNKFNVGVSDAISSANEWYQKNVSQPLSDVPLVGAVAQTAGTALAGADKTLTNLGKLTNGEFNNVSDIAGAGIKTIGGGMEAAFGTAYLPATLGFNVVGQSEAGQKVLENTVGLVPSGVTTVFQNTPLLKDFYNSLDEEAQADLSNEIAIALLQGAGAGAKKYGLDIKAGVAADAIANALQRGKYAAKFQIFVEKGLANDKTGKFQKGALGRIFKEGGKEFEQAMKDNFSRFNEVVEARKQARDFKTAPVDNTNLEDQRSTTEKVKSEIKNTAEAVKEKVKQVNETVKEKYANLNQRRSGNQEQQGQQGFSTTSKNNNGLNQSNFSQKNEQINTKKLNTAQTQLIQNYNRMNPKAIDTFEEKFGENYGQYMYERGFTKAGEDNLKDMVNYQKDLMDIKENALNQIEGRFKDQAITDMLDHLLEYYENTKNRKMLAEFSPLKEQLERDGLTMAEANKIRKKYQYDIRTKFYSDGNSEKIELANNIYLAMKDFLDKTAKENGLDSLDEINREIMKVQHIIGGVSYKLRGSSANNTLGLTDYITLASMLNNPAGLAVFLGKQALKTNGVRNFILEKAVGGKGNAKNRITADKMEGEIERIAKINDEKARNKALEKFYNTYIKPVKELSEYFDNSVAEFKKQFNEMVEEGTLDNALPDLRESDVKSGKKNLVTSKNQVTIEADEKGNARRKGQISEVDKRSEDNKKGGYDNKPTEPKKPAPTQPKNSVTAKPKEEIKTKEEPKKTEVNDDTKKYLYDKNGKQKNVYHYSDTDFKEFDLDKQKNKLGIYFSPNSKPTSKLRKYKITATIDMNKPLVISPENKSSQIYPELKELLSDELEDQYDTKFRELLLRDGYDGVIMLDDKGVVSQYVVLNPEQVNVKKQGAIQPQTKNEVTKKEPEKKTELEAKEEPKKENSELREKFGDKYYEFLEKQVEIINDSNKKAESPKLKEPITVDDLDLSSQFYENKFYKIYDQERKALIDEINKYPVSKLDGELTAKQRKILEQTKSEEEKKALYTKWREERMKEWDMSDEDIAKVEDIMQRFQKLSEQRENYFNYLLEKIEEKNNKNKVTNTKNAITSKKQETATEFMDRLERENAEDIKAQQSDLFNMPETEDIEAIDKELTARQQEDLKNMPETEDVEAMDKPKNLVTNPPKEESKIDKIIRESEGQELKVINNGDNRIVMYKVNGEDRAYTITKEQLDEVNSKKNGKSTNTEPVKEKTEKPKNLVTGKTKQETVAEKIIRESDGAELKYDEDINGDNKTISFTANGKDYTYSVTNSDLKELGNKGRLSNGYEEEKNTLQAKRDSELNQTERVFGETPERDIQAQEIWDNTIDNLKKNGKLESRGALGKMKVYRKENPNGSTISYFEGNGIKGVTKYHFIIVSSPEAGQHNYTIEKIGDEPVRISERGRTLTNEEVAKLNGILKGETGDVKVKDMKINESEVDKKDPVTVFIDTNENTKNNAELKADYQNKLSEETQWEDYNTGIKYKGTKAERVQQIIDSTKLSNGVQIPLRFKKDNYGNTVSWGDWQTSIESRNLDDVEFEYAKFLYDNPNIRSNKSLKADGLKEAIKKGNQIHEKVVEEEQVKAGGIPLNSEKFIWQKPTYKEGVDAVLNEVKKISKWSEQAYSNKIMTPEERAEFAQLRKEAGKAVWTNLKFKSDRSQQYKDLMKNIREAGGDEKKLRAIANTLYIEKVRKDIKDNYAYPEEVTNSVPGLRTAQDNFKRYLKGRDTSFSGKDPRIDYSEKESIGTGMKRQDGKQITAEQKRQIKNGILEYEKILGIDMKKMAEDIGLTYVHLNGKHPFLTSRAVGLFHSGFKSISVGAKEESYREGRGENTETHTTPVVMAHEITHAIDGMFEWALFSDDITRKMDKLMNNSKKMGDYWHRKEEITARMVEEYVDIMKGGKGYYNMNGYWDKDVFEREVKPYVEQIFKEKFDGYRLSQKERDDIKLEEKPKSMNSITSNGLNNVTSK